MGTNLTFTPEEIKVIHSTLIKCRSLLFDATEIRFDKKSTKKPAKNIPRWKGKRGTFPITEDLDKSIALMRIHINSEEALSFYDAIGTFDHPKKEGPVRDPLLDENTDNEISR